MSTIPNTVQPWPRTSSRDRPNAAKTPGFSTTITGATTAQMVIRKSPGTIRRRKPEGDPEAGKEPCAEERQDRRRHPREDLTHRGVERPVARVLHRVDERALQPRRADHGRREPEQREQHGRPVVVRRDRGDEERVDEVDRREDEERDEEEPEEEAREQGPRLVQDGADTHAGDPTAPVPGPQGARRQSAASSRLTWVSAFPSRARFVRSLSQPLAPDGCGRGTATDSSQQEALPDRVRQPPDAEEPLGRHRADGDDEPGREQLQLCVAPRPAERLLGLGRPAIAATARARARVAPGDRRAVEAREELLLLEREPPSERPSCATLPRATGRRLDAARREPEEVGALSRVALEDGPRRRSGSPPRGRGGSGGSGAGGR